MRTSTFLKSLVNRSNRLFASEKFVNFNYKDPLNLESQLTEEEKLVIAIIN